MRFLLFLMFTTKASAIAVGSKSFSKLTTIYKLLLFQCIFTFIIEAIGLYTGVIKGQNNTAMFNFSFIIELWAIGYIGKKLLSQYTVFHKVIPYILSIITAFSLYHIYTTYLAEVSMVAHWAMFLGAILQIALFVLLLYHISNNETKLSSLPSFWLSLAIIIFSGATMPLYGLYNYLATEDVKLMFKIYYINQIASIIRYAFITVSFVIIAKSTQKVINE